MTHVLFLNSNENAWPLHEDEDPMVLEAHLSAGLVDSSPSLVTALVVPPSGEGQMRLEIAAHNLSAFSIHDIG